MLLPYVFLHGRLAFGHRKGDLVQKGELPAGIFQFVGREQSDLAVFAVETRRLDDAALAQSFDAFGNALAARRFDIGKSAKP